MKFSLVCVSILSNNKALRPLLAASDFNLFLKALRPLLAALVFILFLMISACSSHPLGPPGRGIMKEDRFVDLLVDMHYFEGIYAVTGGAAAYNPNFVEDTVDYYQSILEKHGVTRDEFQMSMNYYSYDPNSFELLYNRVVDQLSHRLSEVEMEEPGITEPAMEARMQGIEQENLWNLRESWSFPGPDTNRMISFEVPVAGPGSYTFSARIRLDPFDYAENPRVNIWFWYDDGTEDGFRQSFRPVALNKDGELRQVSVTRELTLPEVTHIRGRVLDMTNPADTGNRSATVLDIRLLYNKPPDQTVR